MLIYIPLFEVSQKEVVQLRSGKCILFDIPNRNITSGVQFRFVFPQKQVHIENILALNDDIRLSAGISLNNAFELHKGSDLLFVAFVAEIYSKMNIVYLSILQ